MKIQTFEHKKDLVSMMALIGVIIILNVLRYVNGYGFSVPVVGLTLVLATFVVWMWLVSSYTIENQVLKIKQGPFTQKIDIREITRIKSGKPSFLRGKLNNFQLTLFYKKGRRLNVFPIDKKGFVNALLEINATIAVD